MSELNELEMYERDEAERKAARREKVQRNNYMKDALRRLDLIRGLASKVLSGEMDERTGMWQVIGMTDYDPEDFIGACDPSLLSDSGAVQDMFRTLAAKPDSGWTYQLSLVTGDGYNLYDMVVADVGHSDKNYVFQCDRLEARLAAAERLVEMMPNLVCQSLDKQLLSYDGRVYVEIPDGIIPTDARVVDGRRLAAADRLAELESALQKNMLMVDGQVYDSRDVKNLLAESDPPPEGDSWEDGSAEPEPSKPGVMADAYLAITIESHEPQVLTYIYGNHQWTSGGGDTQKVRWWKRIVLPTALAAAKKEDSDA